MNKQQFISIDLSIGSYHDICEEIINLAQQSQSEYVCVSNVHMLVEAYKDKCFAEIVNNAIIATPDGLPLTWGLKWIYGIQQDRVAGMDLLPNLLQQASEKNISVFFYGNTTEVLDKTKEYVREHYKGIPSVETYSPPFRELTEKEKREIIEMINASGAKLVFVSLGCPKQEKWMASMKGKVNAIMLGIGAALPVLIGEQSRAPQWMQKAGLEWLYRLCQEPRRLFKRYFVTNTMFIYLLIKEERHT